MFARLQSVLGEYLQQVGGLERTDMGPRKSASAAAISAEQLVDRLRQESTFNNKLVICITILHFLLFIVAVSLVFYYRDDPKIISFILGGSILSLLAVTRS